MDVTTGQLCARARFWASLRIDGELSELEGALLDAHLARCAECSAVAGDFAAVTTGLRAAPLERVTPVVLARRKSPRHIALVAAVVSVVAFAALLGGLVRGQVSHDAVRASHTVAVVASFEGADQLRALRRPTLVGQRTLPRDLVADPV